VVVEEDPEPHVVRPHTTWFGSLVKRVVAMWRNRVHRQVPIPTLASLDLAPTWPAASSAPEITFPTQRDEAACISWMCDRARLKARDVRYALTLAIEDAGTEKLDSREIGMVLDEAWLAYCEQHDESIEWPRRIKKRLRTRLRYGLRQSIVGAQLVTSSSGSGPWSELMYLVGVASLREGSRLLQTSEPTLHGMHPPIVEEQTVIDVR
jgi:hypothetical protein